MQIVRLGQQARDGGLAAARRPPQDQRGELPGRQHAADRSLGSEQMVLAQDVAQRLGPQALSERRGSKRGEQLGHGSNMGCPGRERNHQRNWMVEARPSRPMLTLWTPDAMRVLRSATLLT